MRVGSYPGLGMRGGLAICGAAWVIVLSFVSLGVVVAQGLPKEKTGVSNVETAAVPLAPDFAMTHGRTLRMRKVTILPGGALPMHPHVDRPSVSYVLSGALTEYVAGSDTPRTLDAGASNASFTHAHALLNRGATPAVFIEVDLPEK